MKEHIVSYHEKSIDFPSDVLRQQLPSVTLDKRPGRFVPFVLSLRCVYTSDSLFILLEGEGQYRAQKSHCQLELIDVYGEIVESVEEKRLDISDGNAFVLIWRFPFQDRNQINLNIDFDNKMGVMGSWTGRLIPGFTPDGIMKIATHLYQKCFDIAPDRIEFLAGDGSRRKVLRIHSSKKDPIIAIYGESRKENSRFITLANRFRTLGLSVPKVYAEGAGGLMYLLEDLGNVRLSDVMPTFNDKERRLIYRTILDDLVRLHLAVMPRGKDQGFPRSAFLSDLYYSEREFIARMSPNKYGNLALEADFLNLVNAMERAPITGFVFRDFQSKNIMMKGEQPYYIDFQSGLTGSCFYDLASLLVDPNADLDLGMQSELLGVFEGLHRWEMGIGKIRTSDDFVYFYNIFGLHRLLQALAAFCYLGFVQDKKDFIATIPSGLRQIQRVIDSNPSLVEQFPTLVPVLNDIVSVEEYQDITYLNNHFSLLAKKE